MPTKKNMVTAQGASKAVGYGYSAAILSQLMSSLDQPINNTDGFKISYKQMLTEDETISTGLEYLTGRVVSRIGDYSHKDPKIKELVDNCIESIRGTMTSVRRAILRDSFAFGYGVAEFTIKSENGQWLLSSMPVLDPTTVSFKMTRFEDNSYGVGSVIQSGVFGQDIEIPVGKCLVKTYGAGDSPYGQSILRRCYRWYELKKAVIKFWAVALERFGMPLLWGKASSEKTMDALIEAMANADSRAYIAVDSDSEVGAITTPSDGAGGSYAKADELCDKKIYRSLFLPSLLGAGENGGSYSLGKVHLELFNATAASLAYDYIEAETEQLWRPIIEWNFGPQEDYGKWNVTDIMPTEEKKTLSDMFVNLANAGVIDPDSDRKTIREALSLPDIEEGAVFPKWGLEQKREQRELQELERDGL